MAIADYQNALMGLQGVPSSVRAVPQFREPVIEQAGYIGRNIIRGTGIAANIARREAQGEQEKREIRGFKEEYRAGVSLGALGVGVKAYKENKRTMADRQQEKQHAKEQRRSDAIMSALLGTTKQMVETLAPPEQQAGFVGPPIYTPTYEEDDSFRLNYPHVGIYEAPGSIQRMSPIKGGGY